MLLNENTLAEHLSVDFGYNIMCGTFSTVCEVHSRITNLDKIIRSVNLKVYDTVKNPENGRMYSIVIDENDFKDIGDGFFDTIRINIGFGVMCLDGGNNISSYNASKSTVSPDGKVHVEIDINVSSITYIDTIERLDIVLGHELIHAMQDISMRKKGLLSTDEKGSGDYDTIISMVKGSGKFRILSHNEKLYVRMLGRVLYFLHKTEQKAFIGQCFSEISKMKNEIKDSKTAYGVIKKTDTWKGFEMVDGYIDLICNVSDPNVRDELLQAYCDVFDKNYLNVNYDNFLNSLKLLYSKSVDNFFRKGSKMACDAYMESDNLKKRSYNELFFESLIGKTEIFMKNFGIV